MASALPIQPPPARNRRRDRGTSCRVVPRWQTLNSGPPSDQYIRRDRRHVAGAARPGSLRRSNGCCAAPGIASASPTSSDSAAREGTAAAWPALGAGRSRRRLPGRWVSTVPWAHQVAAAELAWAGPSVVVATGTASGKSLGYLLPALSAALYGQGSHACTSRPPRPWPATSCERSPSSACRTCEPRRTTATRRSTNATGPAPRRRGADQPGHAHHVTAARSCPLVVVPAAAAVRRHRRVPRLPRRVRFARRTGAAAAAPGRGALRQRPGVHPRLGHRRPTRRTTARGCSALPVEEVVDDASPRGAARRSRCGSRRCSELLGEHDAPGTPVGDRRGRRAARRPGRRRRPHARLRPLPARRRVSRARRPARLLLEVGARSSRTGSPPTAPATCPRTAAPSRRALHRGDIARDGQHERPRARRRRQRARRRAASPAGPARGPRCGSRPAGPAASGSDALAVLIARDDPLDTYLVHHPEAVFGRPVEAAVLDPDNPYVLTPHLAAAAAELPLTDATWPLFGPAPRPRVDELVAAGLLRRRPTGWFWTARERRQHAGGPARHRRASRCGSARRTPVG